MKTITWISSVFALLILLSSFISKDENLKKLPKSFREDYAYIPAGKVYIGKDSSAINDFFICRHEVSNLEYRTFLNELSKAGKTEELKKCIVDSTNWEGLDRKPNPNPMLYYYFRHPAYDNYPVVNINQEAATLYCKWLTEKINKEAQNGLLFECRIPTRTEWIGAAQGSSRYLIYTWPGSLLLNSKGLTLCNYIKIGSEDIHYNDTLKTYQIMEPRHPVSGNTVTDITAPVYSYWPNQFGLFNMNGNVAEIVSEKGIAVGGSWHSTGYDVRNESVMYYDVSSPQIGFRPILIIKK